MVVLIGFSILDQQSFVARSVQVSEFSFANATLTLVSYCSFNFSSVGSSTLLDQICSCCFCDSYGDISQQPQRTSASFDISSFVTSQPASQEMFYGATSETCLLGPSSSGKEMESPGGRTERRWSALETLKGRGRFRPS